MWLLHFLPDGFLLFIVNTILVLGIVSSFLAFFVLHRILNKFPTLAPYHLVFQIVSALLLVTGIYFKGGYSVEMQWRERVAELETKLEQAKVESNKVNTVIQEKVVYKDRVIQKQGERIVQYVDRPVIQEYDKKCPIPKEVIDIHNEASQMNLIVEQQNKEMNKK